MSAASYIGRVGGLAVALGVGTAIFTGQGVANATTDGDNSQTGAQASDGQGTETTEAKDTDSGSLGKIENKVPRLSDIIGRHRADDSTPTSVTATSIVKRLSEATKRVTDALENAAGSVDRDNASVRTTTRTNGSSLKERLAQPSEPAVDAASAVDDTTPTGKIVANQFTNPTAAVKDWLATPRALAGRTVGTSTVPRPSTLWTPPRILTAPLGTMKATPGTSAATVRSTNLLTSVLNVFNPLAGSSPTSPGVDSPLAFVMAGAARRELGIDSFAALPLLAPSSNSLTYAPDVFYDRGVISGDNSAAPTGLAYFIGSQPDGGGKIYVDPATGNLTYLPDISTVDNQGTENFSVIVVKPTALTSAITGVPLIGSLASQVLVVLYKIPVVNVVLSPIIGQSKVTDVSIDLTDVEGYTDGAPVAFTVMVPSPKDGTLISTNYFPAYSVVDGFNPATGTAPSAPTILNGPGLATAGNIDPNAPNTVDGLVPGLNDLRAAGYNVVTWDPRGEFDSGGTLQLDSPIYEGQDVKGIINFLSADENQRFVHQAFDDDVLTDNNDSVVEDDPAIGMVGGSYGGGIQLASAWVDQRVDVIVPGIAWNSLEDALYPDQAFKTSYASLLLLGLVTTGSRINPQIYAGIITGDVLGILLPGQIQLLRNSGPYYFIDQINTPTMFIQGTVDVLFPLDQALTNASTIGTPPEDVRMIWYCGGHGVCLTMNDDQLADQDARLTENTIAWLDAYLQGGDASAIPKFQYVDQLGVWHSATILPNDGGFHGNTPITATAAGGLLGIVPILGGSGPESKAGFPQSLGLGSPATNAIKVPIHYVPTGDDPTTTYVVGSPHLTFDYSGVGTTRHVYAQIVDKNTGLVVGNIVTPVSVTLDGTDRKADVDMENIAWTYTNETGDMNDEGNYDDLELQIVSSATAYEDFTSFGVINIKNVNVSLPVAKAGVVHPDPAMAEPLAV